MYNSPTNHTDSSGHIIDTLVDALFLAQDVYNCLGNSDALSCYMVGPGLAATIIPGLPNPSGGRAVGRIVAGTSLDIDDLAYAIQEFGERAKDVRTARLKEMATKRDIIFIEQLKPHERMEALPWYIVAEEIMESPEAAHKYFLYIDPNDQVMGVLGLSGSGIVKVPGYGNALSIKFVEGLSPSASQALGAHAIILSRMLGTDGALTGFAHEQAVNIYKKAGAVFVHSGLTHDRYYLSPTHAMELLRKLHRGR